MNLLKLIRYKNLLMIATLQLLIKYVLFDIAIVDNIKVVTALNGLHFTLLILATVCIAAGGYIINDIYTMETHVNNKPNSLIIGKSITENTANKLYIGFTFIGVCIGFYLSHVVNRPGFFSIFVIISGLIYVYASYLKQLAVVGNLVVAAVVFMSLIIVGIFDLIPATNNYDQTYPSNMLMLRILTDFGVFLFIINVIHDLVKDIQEVDGDHKMGITTLPILVGKARSSKIVMVLTISVVIIIIIYINKHLYDKILAVLYFLIAIIGPLLYIIIKLFTVENNAQYKTIALILKLVMITGMLSMVIYKIIL